MPRATPAQGSIPAKTTSGTAKSGATLPEQVRLLQGTPTKAFDGKLFALEAMVRDFDTVYRGRGGGVDFQSVSRFPQVIGQDPVEPMYLLSVDRGFGNTTTHLLYDDEGKIGVLTYRTEN